MNYDRLYEFWVGEQGVPGSLLGDFLVLFATYVIGKYKVAPWIHRRHVEHLDQNERQHQELLAEHRKLFDLHTRQHQQLLQIVQDRSPDGSPDGGASPSVPAEPVP